MTNNRLQYESSPYLLQHAHNPVDWFPWGAEALAKAKAEDKPILISIGYSACHWCHVMERESFENEDVAAIMNTHFVNIKVDREERPDIDHIYMEACQILTGSGGWPLNCFLTPEGKPFYAGTYFPPRPAHGRPSWPQLLQHIHRAFVDKRDVVEEQAEKLLEHIQRNGDRLTSSPVQLDPALAMQSPVNDTWTRPIANKIFAALREQFDRRDGGFGGAPKFPGTMSLHFLLCYAQFTRNQEAREHVLFSLEKMAAGGIYDQIGGGFARYAVDGAWLVPHFEKMLYDNALLVSVYCNAYKVYISPVFERVVSETLHFFTTEMRHPEGGFYAALDADSEGVEGKYYVWEKSELDKLLGDDAALFCTYYGVTADGNWEGVSILNRAVSDADFEKKHADLPFDWKRRVDDAAQRALSVRKNRIPPGLDDKILIGWNALMVSALVAASHTFQNEAYRVTARQTIDFLLRTFVTPDDPAKLLHTFSYRDKKAKIPAVLDDYANLIAALIDVYTLDFDAKYLRRAVDYCHAVQENFLDEASGFFFQTGVGQADLVVRSKEIYDNATPSGNSTMCLNLIRLGLLTDRPEWVEQSRKMLLTMAPSVQRFPSALGQWAMALLGEIEGWQEISVLGDNAVNKVRDLQMRFLPFTLVGASKDETDFPAILQNKFGDEDALVYLCKNNICQKPVSSLSDLKIFQNNS